MIGELQRLVSPPSGICSMDGWAEGGVATLFTTNDAEHSEGNPGKYQTGGMNNLFFESAGSDHSGRRPLRHGRRLRAFHRRRPST